MPITRITNWIVNEEKMENDMYNNCILIKTVHINTHSLKILSIYM